MSRGTIIDQELKRKIIDIGDGLVTLTSTKRRCRHLGQPGDSMSCQTGHGRDFAAKLVFEPKNTNKMLTISVSQGQVVYDSFTSILPQITVNSILPPESLVFRLAASGSIQELMSLVADGKASLHDHDTFGQSLLHVSHSLPSLGNPFNPSCLVLTCNLKYSVINFQMCKFLIDQGLDVNEHSVHGYVI